MRAASALSAGLCALALVAYPLTLFPGSTWARTLALLCLGAAGAAIALRSHVLIAATGGLTISLYLLSLASRAAPHSLAAVAGVGILLLLELLDLAVSDAPVERALLRRRGMWISGSALAGGAVALTAQAAGELVEAVHPFLFVAAALCAGLALACVSALASGAVADKRS